MNKLADALQRMLKAHTCMKIYFFNMHSGGKRLNTSIDQFPRSYVSYMAFFTLTAEFADCSRLANMLETSEIEIKLRCN